MSDIEVGLDRNDLACTIVLLKAKHASGFLRTPLAVELLPPALQDEGWELEAKRYLSAALQAKQEQKKLSYTKNISRMSTKQWENLSEEFGFNGPK